MRPVAPEEAEMDKLSRIKTESRSWKNLSEDFNVVLFVRRAMGDCRLLGRTASPKPGAQADQPWKAPSMDSRGEGPGRSGPPPGGCD